LRWDGDRWPPEAIPCGVSSDGGDHGRLVRQTRLAASTINRADQGIPRAKPSAPGQRRTSFFARWTGPIGRLPEPAGDISRTGNPAFKISNIAVKSDQTGRPRRWVGDLAQPQHSSSSLAQSLPTCETPRCLCSAGKHLNQNHLRRRGPFPARPPRVTNESRLRVTPPMRTQIRQQVDTNQTAPY
jgi:hypothetical protein